MKQSNFLKMFVVLATLMSLVSCKTKQVAVETEKQNHFIDATEKVEKQQKDQVTTIVENNSAEVRELTELLHSLNVSYAGEDINDKLDLLLSKSDNGTKLTISGKGIANYTDSQNTNIESLRTELYARQDSIHDVELSYLQDLNAKIDSYIRNKTKDIKTNTFTTAVWIIIGLAVVLGICLNWISKQFKNPLKMV